jgi:hypothetical protein
MSANTPKTRACRANSKSQLYANLARYDIWRVVIGYDGSGDSGCIGYIELYDADDKVKAMPEQQVTYTTETRVYDEKTKRFEKKRVSRSGPLREAIESWCYDLLEEHYGGWEIDGGSDGTIVLNVPTKTGSWEHNSHYTETSTYEREV